MKKIVLIIIVVFIYLGQLVLLYQIIARRGENAFFFKTKSIETELVDDFSYEKCSSMIEDPCFHLQWHINDNFDYIDENNCSRNSLANMNMMEAWQKFSAKRSVIIAIIDTGIDYSHEDLQLNIWINELEIVNDKIDNDNNGYIDDIHGWNFCENTNDIYNNNFPVDNHGTHIAGIIAAESNKVGIRGIVSDPLIKIMILKVVDPIGSNNTQENLINAIYYAEKMGADICNISASMYFNEQKLKDVIDSSNMMFVVAAGNSISGIDLDEFPLYPAAYDSENIIAVANLQCNGELNLMSNYGPKSIDIAAPGTSIWSTLINNDYGYLTGTSIATPMVTGILAMIYSHYDYISLYDAKKILLNSCKKITGLENKVLTGGIPNASKALSYDKESIRNLEIE